MLRDKTKRVSLLTVIIYSVGITGLMLPATRNIFIKLIPLVIILSLASSLSFHSGRWDLKTIFVFSSIIILSWLTEAAGVATGRIFGTYSYGHALGLKLLETPLIIGFNWLLLVYGTASIVSALNLQSPPAKVVLASAMMVLYDFFLEMVAPSFDMWRFENTTAPFMNYLSWFILAMVFHSAVRIAGIKISNPVASIIFIVQLLFFIILTILLHITG